VRDCKLYVDGEQRKRRRSSFCADSAKNSTQRRFLPPTRCRRGPPASRRVEYLRGMPAPAGLEIGVALTPAQARHRSHKSGLHAESRRAPIDSCALVAKRLRAGREGRAEALFAYP